MAAALGLVWGPVITGNAMAQVAAVAPAAAPTATPAPANVQGPAGSVVTNLIRQLVQEGVLTQEKAEALIRQAQDEAVTAERSAAVPRAGVVTPMPADTSVRVPYVPQIVRNQIRDEVRQDVLREAREQNWAAPNAVPEWTKRFHLNGDFRLRYEWSLFDSRNSNAFPNFAALNAGSPFDLNNAAGTPPPILNTTQSRERMRIRARLGVSIDVNDDVVAGIRLATGNTTNPVTTNQTLGTTLNKYNFLLDRAFLLYRPADWAEFWMGRFASPFMNTDLMWDDDIAMDGVAARLTPKLGSKLSLLTVVGAFPIENTVFNFPDNTILKSPSRDKWLYAAQIGFNWQPARGYDFKLAAAYYQFNGIEGRLSAACVANTAADPCNTDNSRPGFQQQGNTLFAIRNLVSNATTPPLFQYYGLASSFRNLDITTRLDISLDSDTHVVLDGDVVRNLAFSPKNILASSPVNNIGPNLGSAPGVFDGGKFGYQARITLGQPDIRERWEWNTSFAYKHLDSDAVPDAFTESDFHLGGTNAKGYVVGVALGLAHNVNLSARWLSASEVTSLPYTVDVVQVDLNARF